MILESKTFIFISIYRSNSFIMLKCFILFTINESPNHMSVMYWWTIHSFPIYQEQQAKNRKESQAITEAVLDLNSCKCTVHLLIIHHVLPWWFNSYKNFWKYLSWWNIDGCLRPTQIFLENTVIKWAHSPEQILSALDNFLGEETCNCLKNFPPYPHKIT